jgi:hypothetical protein
MISMQSLGKWLYRMDVVLDAKPAGFSIILDFDDEPCWKSPHVNILLGSTYTIIVVVTGPELPQF